MPETSKPGERWTEGAAGELPAGEETLLGTPPLLVGPTGTSPRPRPPATSRPRRDPRDDLHLVEADVPGLSFVIENMGVLQGQMAEACYPGRKESIISRRVHRWLRDDFARIDRFLSMGCNQIFATEKAGSALIEAGYDHPERFFPRSRPIAPKDLGHHLTIVDLVIVARRGVPFTPDAIEPDWLLRRRWSPAPPAVPDLLLTVNLKGSGARKLFAYEVDCGTESLRVFAPKLERLSTTLLERSAGGPAAVMILTRGAGRAASIEEAVAKLPVPMMVKLLPRVTGRPSIAALEKLLSGRG